MGFDFDISPALDLDNSPSEAVLPAPGKTTRTQHMKGPSIAKLLKEYKALYKKIRTSMKRLAVESDQDLAGAQQLETDFLQAESLYKRLATSAIDPGQASELDDIQHEVERLYREALPILRQHGIGPNTGVAVIDQGFGCSHGGIEGCNLTADERKMTWEALSVVVDTAMENLRDAIQNKRLDKMLQKDSSSWGFWAEFFFYSVTGPLIAAAVKGLKKAKEAAAVAKEVDKMLREAGIESVKNAGTFQKMLLGVSDENATATLQNASRGLRTSLKNKAHEGNEQGWDVFLKMIQSGIKQVADNILLDGPAQMNDVELVALVHGYRDPVAHSVETYEIYLDDILSRYQSQHLDQINTRHKDGGKTRTVVLEAYGKTCTGILSDHGTGSVGTFGVGMDRERVHGDGISYLLSIVDEDLAPYAQQLNAGIVETLQVTVDQQPFVFPSDDHLVQGNNAEHRFKRWVQKAKDEHDAALLAKYEGIHHNLDLW